MKRQNALNQKLDIAGSSSPADDLVLSNEATGTGQLTGKSGATASITVASSFVTLTGLSGFAVTDLGNSITITGAEAANNGTFAIILVNSASSVNIDNDSGVAPDSNNGSISWVERYPYTLEDDLNYERTDRSAIKGTAYNNPLPTYERPTNIGTNVPTNLTNITGKTLDAVGFIMSRTFEGATPSIGADKITLSGTDEFKHSDAVNKTGSPVFDHPPYANDFSACYVNILDPDTGDHLVVKGDGYIGERIYGLTNDGASTSPNSIEVLFYSAPVGADLSLESHVYNWEAAQIVTVTLVYGYFTQADQLDENAFRTTQVLGFGSSSEEHKHLRHLIHLALDGPFEGFFPNMFQELLPSGEPFPTSIIWWDDPGKNFKIVEETITYNGNHTINTYEYKVFDVDGISVLATVTDTYNYNGVFIVSRNRAVV